MERREPCSHRDRGFPSRQCALLDETEVMPYPFAVLSTDRVRPKNSALHELYREKRKSYAVSFEKSYRPQSVGGPER